MGARVWGVAAALAALASLSACGGGGGGTATTTTTSTTTAATGTTSPTGTGSTGGTTPPSGTAAPAVVTVCKGAQSEANNGKSSMLISTVEKAMQLGGTKYASDVRAWLLETNTVTRKADAEVVVQDCKTLGALPSS